MNPVFKSKQIIRDHIRELRRKLSRETILEKSLRIGQKLKSLPQFQAAKTIHCYVSWQNEVFTHDLIREMLADGKQVVVPVVQMPDHVLVHSRLSDFSDLQEGAFGILEPPPEKRQPVSPQALDVVLAPGVAFDLRGYRLGYGGGFYDHFLAQTDALKIGLAFDFQIVDRIPTRREDERVDMIVSEENVYVTSK